MYWLLSAAKPWRENKNKKKNTDVDFQERWNMKQSSVNFVLKHWRSGSCREDANEFHIKPADWSFSLPKGEEGPMSVRAWVCVCVCVCVWEREREREREREKKREGTSAATYS